jgi:type I restriction enzyme S subunit
MIESLPPLWTKCIISNLATFHRGVNYKKELAQSEPHPDFLPVLRANNIDGDLNFNDLVYVPDKFVKNGQFLQANDILFAMSSGSKHLVGKSARSKTSFRGGFGAFCGLLRPVDGIDALFLAFFFQSPAYRHFISELSSGININNLRQSDILSLDFPLPPLPEQHRIVAKIEELFSDLDAGTASLRKAKAQLKTYRQSVLKWAFEGKLTEEWRKKNKPELASKLLKRIKAEREKIYKEECKNAKKEGTRAPRKLEELPAISEEELERLSRLPDEWAWVFLKNVSEGPEYGSSAKSKKEGKVPVLRMGNIQNCFFDWSDLVFSNNREEIHKYWLKPGDVLFNRTNSPELVGKTALYKGEREAIFAGYLIRVNQVKQIVPGYLNYFLNSGFAHEYGNKVKTDGVNQSNINGEKLGKYRFPLCSENEQEEILLEIESRLSVADNLEKTIDASLAQADALRQSILKRAFEGKLVPQDPNDPPAAELLEQIKADKESAIISAPETKKWNRSLS